MNRLMSACGSAPRRRRLAADVRKPARAPAAKSTISALLKQLIVNLRGAALALRSGIVPRRRPICHNAPGDSGDVRGDAADAIRQHLRPGGHRAPEVCSLKISRPCSDVADWSVHDPQQKSCCIAQAIGHLTDDSSIRWLEIST